MYQCKVLTKAKMCSVLRQLKPRNKGFYHITVSGNTENQGMVTQEVLNYLCKCNKMHSHKHLFCFVLLFKHTFTQKQVNFILNSAAQGCICARLISAVAQTIWVSCLGLYAWSLYKNVCSCECVCTEHVLYVPECVRVGRDTGRLFPEDLKW